MRTRKICLSVTLILAMLVSFLPFRSQVRADDSNLPAIPNASMNGTTLKFDAVPGITDYVIDIGDCYHIYTNIDAYTNYKYEKDLYIECSKYASNMKLGETYTVEVYGRDSSAKRATQKFVASFRYAPPLPQLSTPTNFQFDSENGILSWDPVTSGGEQVDYVDYTIYVKAKKVNGSASDSYEYTMYSYKPECQIKACFDEGLFEYEFSVKATKSVYPESEIGYAPQKYQYNWKYSQLTGLHVDERGEITWDAVPNATDYLIQIRVPGRDTYKFTQSYQVTQNELSAMIDTNGLDDCDISIIVSAVWNPGACYIPLTLPEMVTYHLKTYPLSVIGKQVTSLMDLQSLLTSSIDGNVAYDPDQGILKFTNFDFALCLSDLFSSGALEEIPGYLFEATEPLTVTGNASDLKAAKCIFQSEDSIVFQDCDITGTCSGMGVNAKTVSFANCKMDIQSTGNTNCCRATDQVSFDGDYNDVKFQTYGQSALCCENGEITLNKATIKIPENGTLDSGKHNICTSNGQTPAMKVEVFQATPTPKPLSVSYTEKTINAGETFQFSAKNTNDQNVTWKVGNTSVATVDANGKVTAKKAGNTYLYATTPDGRQAKCLLKIVEAKPLSITYSEKTINVASTFTFSAKNATGQTLTWSIGNTKIATVDANGKVTAKAPGNTYLTVKSSDGRSTKCLIKVVYPTLSLKYTEKTVYLNQSFSFTANNACGQKITWRVGNTSIATVDANGKVTGKKAGNTYLYAKSADGREAKCLIKVVDPGPLNIRYTEKTIKVGSSFQFTAKNPAGQTVSWRVGNSAVATVDASGNVTGKSVANTYLYAKTPDGREVRCLIKVVA